jgi:hypothetical protein
MVSVERSSLYAAYHVHLKELNMSDDKIVGSTLLPGRVLTPTVDTEEVRVGDERFDEISQDYLNSSSTSVPTSKALYEAFIHMQSAVNEIDPNNNFFRDNSVISQPLSAPTFNVSSEWHLTGWVFDDSKAIYVNTGAGDNNELYIKSERLSSPGYHFFKVTIDRIDTGVIELRDADDLLVRNFNKEGTFYIEYVVKDPNVASFRFISKGLYPNEVAVISYIGLHKVSDRIRDYLLFRLEEFGIVDEGIPDTIQAQLDSLRNYVNGRVADLTDKLDIHTTNFNNPHYVTRALLQAAAIDHTHTPASIGAAATYHTHQPEECGAAPEIHGHTPQQCGAAPEVHTHTPDECGAAPAIHVHDQYVTTATHAQDIGVLEQRITLISSGNATSVTGDVNEPPLKITSAPASAVGTAYKVRAGWDENVFLEELNICYVEMCRAEAGRPISTLKGKHLYHFAQAMYDAHMGELFPMLPFNLNAEDSVTTAAYLTNEFSIARNIFINSNYEPGEFYDIVNHVPINPRNFVMYDVSVPYIAYSYYTSPLIFLGQLPSNSYDAAFRFVYKFHAAQSVSSVMIKRRYDNTVTSIANVTSNGLCAKSGEVIFYYKGTIVGSTAFNFSISDWGSNYQKEVIVVNSTDIDAYEVKITDVHSMMLAVPGFGSTPTSSVWTFAMHPVFKGTETTLTLRDEITFVSNVEAEAGVKELTLEIPKTITIDGITRPKDCPSSCFYAVLNQKTPLNVTNGLYELETYLSYIPLEMSEGMPYGTESIFAHLFTDSTTHPYWGTVSHSFYGSLILNSLTSYTYSANTGQALAGINIYMFSAVHKWNHIGGVSVKLMDSNNNLVLDRIFYMHDMTRFPIDEFTRTHYNSNFIREFMRRKLEINFDQVYTNITNLELKFVNVNSNSSLNQLEVVINNIYPRFVGLHYDTRSKTLYDYQRGITPSCILGKILPVASGVNEVTFMPLSIIQDLDEQFICTVEQPISALVNHITTPEPDKEFVGASMFYPTTKLGDNRNIRAVEVFNNKFNIADNEINTLEGIAQGYKELIKVEYRTEYYHHEFAMHAVIR